MAIRQTDVLVEQAKQAKRTNDLTRARSLLSQAIKANPRDEEAWLLFADVAEKKDHAIYSLEQVLKINPVNMEALDRLNALKAPIIPAAPTTPIPTTPPQPLVDRVAATTPQASGRETVILEERMHGAVFMVPLLMAVVAIAVGVLIGSLRGEFMGLLGFFAGAIFMLAALLELLRTTVRFATSRLTLTNKRIIIKRGLLDRHTFEILLTKVEGIGIRQPFVARLFGFGTIVVTGTGGAHQRFPGLRDPQGFREQVQEEIAAVQGRQS